MTFRIWVALESLQYLDNHEPQRFDFCIECTPTDIPCQLYHHQVKIMIIYEGTNNLVSGAFLKCFSIFHYPRLFCYDKFCRRVIPQSECDFYQNSRNIEIVNSELWHGDVATLKAVKYYLFLNVY